MSPSCDRRIGILEVLSFALTLSRKQKGGKNERSNGFYRGMCISGSMREVGRK